MLTLQSIDTTQIILIGFILVALVLLGWRFNNYIDAQMETDPLGSYSATYTVIGVAYTLVAAACVLTLFLGWQTAVFAVGIIFVCFAVSGTPMIFGDMRRGSRRRYIASQHDNGEANK